MEQEPIDLNPPNNQPYNTYGGGNLPVPNSTAVLVLGILSIVLCWCYFVPAIVMGIIALVLASSGEREYRLNPQAYTIASYKNLRSGKTCAIIGLSLVALAVLCFIIYVILVGTLAFNFLNLGLAH